MKFNLKKLENNAINCKSLSELIEIHNLFEKKGIKKEMDLKTIWEIMDNKLCVLFRKTQISYMNKEDLNEDIKIFQARDLILTKSQIRILDTIFPSLEFEIKEIAEILTLDRTTVQKETKRLVELNYLTKEKVKVESKYRSNLDGIRKFVYKKVKNG